MARYNVHLVQALCTRYVYYMAFSLRFTLALFNVIKFVWDHGTMARSKFVEEMIFISIFASN